MADIEVPPRMDSCGVATVWPIYTEEQRPFATAAERRTPQHALAWHGSAIDWGVWHMVGITIIPISARTESHRVRALRGSDATGTR
jgi:hypothetical protein